MTTYRPGDVVLVAFPFTGSAQSRQRPALVLLDTGDADVILARITTQPHRTPFDVAIADWQGAGLIAASVIRLHKVATIERALIRRQLGHLAAADRKRVSSVLRSSYGRW
jgi:mRNA interferase MazF